MLEVIGRREKIRARAVNARPRWLTVRFSAIDASPRPLPSSGLKKIGS